MVDAKADMLTKHVLLTVVKRRGGATRALRAFLKAVDLMGLAFGVRVAELRERKNAVQAQSAELVALRCQLAVAQQTIALLQRKLDKIPSRQRPHYDPDSRFRILSLKHLLYESQHQTADIFRVAPSTIARWEAELAAQPETKAIGALVQPTSPIRRYADVVRQLVQTMAWAGFPGNRTIAQTLARAGWKLSVRTVGRMRKEQRPRSTTPPGQPTSGRAVRARFPGHVMMMDVTDLPSFLRIWAFKLAVVLDVYSRMPLAARLCDAEPSAADVAALVQQAVTARRVEGGHIVTDRGPQFTAGVFRRMVAHLGLRQRIGAIGRTGSIALIERLWRTLKQSLRIRSHPSLCRIDLEKRLELGLRYYAYLRPHQGLGGATPAEVYFGITPAHLSAVHPPRARPGEGTMHAPVAIAYLDPDRHLPFLIRRAA
jgi:transposase InsO family protein